MHHRHLAGAIQADHTGAVVALRLLRLLARKLACALLACQLLVCALLMFLLW